MKMIKVLALIWCLFATTLVEAQKVVKKTSVNPNTHFIQVDVSKSFQLDIRTSNEKELIVEATIDGEYKNDLQLNTIEDGQTVFVSTDFRPNFVDPNDKLSAHKVISIALNIILPKGKNVNIHGTNCNVYATGEYKNLTITLSDGRCILNDVKEDVLVNTQSGDIKVENPNATIEASTKYGKVYRGTEQKGDYYYELTSVTGNIYLSKTE